MTSSTRQDRILQKTSMVWVETLSLRFRRVICAGLTRFDFYAALNMVYSDYCKVARDHKVANEDFFVDMAMAFLFDRDGIDPSDKICAYHKYIARHDYDVF